MNVTSLYYVSISEEQGQGKEDDEEKYIADMINIIGRPILFIFGTAGTYYLDIKSSAKFEKKNNLTQII